MNRWCGPKASPYERFEHSLLAFDDFISCEWCGEQMSPDEGVEWEAAHKVKLPIHKGIRREWSE